MATALNYSAQRTTVFKTRYDQNAWKGFLNLHFSNSLFLSRPLEVDYGLPKELKASQLGEVTLSDGEKLVLFEVRADSARIARNRVMLNDAGKKLLKNYGQANALISFYSSDQDEWRFSFVGHHHKFLEDGSVDVTSTVPRRFTYVFGTREQHRTANERFHLLEGKRGSIVLKDLFEAFNVEALNKEFFKEYKAQYEKFAGYLADNYRELFIGKKAKAPTEEERDKEEKPIRDYAKKLLGRLVFLQFLQKKGWMGCPIGSVSWTKGDPQFLKTLFDQFPKKEQFHSQCLRSLFYETLNNPHRSNNIFELKGISPCRIPYLNGGLFDNDEPIGKVLELPAKYFESLFEFFAQYNFTIDENHPEDFEVGIDPEMLGRIFENLLEENRAKGAFYTPRAIVQFMCQGSLIEYLASHLPSLARIPIENFVHKHNANEDIRSEALKLDSLLQDVKICDPAIGSGAFPMGLLQEIFTLRQHLYPFLPGAAKKAFDPLTIKRNIIQNNIYGVDLDKGAVDIARLRFWLSLVVDEQVPQPLPNLDYKIMQGNSLLESYKNVRLGTNRPHNQSVKVFTPSAQSSFLSPTDRQMGLVFAEEKALQLDEILDKYFTCPDPKAKKDLRNQINREVENHLAFNVDLRLKQAERFLGEAVELLESLKLADANTTGRESRNLKAREKQEKLVEARAEEVRGLKEAAEELVKMQNKAERPYFLWHVYFKDVLIDRGGFDIVIANPPYIQLQKIKDQNTSFEFEGYETHERTGDIYSLFYELGLRILKPSGVLVYITSNKWMRAAYGESLRSFFLRSDPKILIDFGGNQVFESATVDTNIILLKKSKNTDSLWVCSLEKAKGGIKNLSDYVRQHGRIKTFQTPSANWVVVGDELDGLRRKIKDSGTRVAELDIEIYRGIVTGLNDAFIISNDIKEQLCMTDPRSVEIIRPILRGKDIKKWVPKWDGYWIINTHNGGLGFGPPINVRGNYPAIYQHLLKYEQPLVKRYDQGANWTNLRSCAYLPEFEKVKLVWKEIGSHIKFCVDENGMMSLDTTRIATGENIYFMCAFLNSKIGRWGLNQTAQRTGTGDLRIKAAAVESLHLPNTSALAIDKVESLTKQLIRSIEKADFSKASHLEDRINDEFFYLFDIENGDKALINNALSSPVNL